MQLFTLERNNEEIAEGVVFSPDFANRCRAVVAFYDGDVQAYDALEDLIAYHCDASTIIKMK